MSELSAAVVETFTHERRPYDVVSARGAWVAVLYRRFHSPVAELRREVRALGGLPVDVANVGPGPEFPLRFDRLKLIAIRGNEAFDVPLASGVRVLPIGFSHDEQVFAFAAIEPDGIVLRWVDCASRHVDSLGTIRLNGTGVLRHRAIASWIGSSHDIVVLAVDEQAVSAVPLDEEGPTVLDSRRDDCPPEWLRFAARDGSRRREDIERYFRSIPVVVDTVARASRHVGPSGLFDEITPSPDGRFLLASRLFPPYPNANDVPQLATAAAILDVDTGAIVQDLSSAAERSVPGGLHRGWAWSAAADAEVVWMSKAASADRILSWPAPFRGAPIIRHDATTACTEIGWTTSGRLVAGERDATHGESWRVGDVVLATEAKRTLHAPRDGEEVDLHLLPVAARPQGGHPAGGDSVFLAGHAWYGGAQVPFVDRVDVESGMRTRILGADGQRGAGELRRGVAILANDGGILLTRTETAESPSRLGLLDVTSGAHRFIEEAAGAPSLSRLRRHIVKWRRLDGLVVDVPVFLPETRAGEQPYPLLLWLYPHAEGRLEPRAATNEYLLLRGVSPVFLAAHGYAVVDTPPLSFAADRPSGVADFFQNVERLVDALIADGCVDARRMAVGGFCAGAWAAAVLCTHLQRFRAAILCSGFYNLTAIRDARPVTGQVRSWDDPATCLEWSPLAAIERLTAPVLIVHGELEEIPVDPRSQSQSLFAALVQRCRTVRYVRLPGERHVYVGRENMMRVYTEMLTWCDDHVKGIATEARDHGEAASVQAIV